MISLLLELCHETEYCVEPYAFRGMRDAILGNVALHASANLGTEVRLHNAAFFRNGKLHVSDLSKAAFLTNADMQKCLLAMKEQLSLADDDAGDSGAGDPEVKYINIVRLTGAMTRGGGDCSYGSRDLRDNIMSAADDADCVGHIIYCHTPGGVAATLRDYRKAINYAHAHGQKVYMYCDGDIASGGTFLSAMCDGVYASNPKDQIGSIGMYRAFFTQKDGDKNTISQETYHEYYASKSTDKNKWYRDAAQGDMQLVAEQTEADLDLLLADLKADRPSILDEQMTGDMYVMEDVVGSLIDGFTTMADLCNMVYEEHAARKGAEVPAKNGASKSNNNNNQASATAEPQHASIMYQNIAKAAGLGEGLEVHAGGIFLSSEYADLVETALGTEHPTEEQLQNVTAERDALQTRIAELEAAAAEAETAHQTAISEMQQAHATEIEQLNAAHTSAVETANTEHAAALEAVNAQLTEQTEQNGQLTAQVTDLTQQVTDRDARIAELEAAPNTTQVPGAPANNGKGAQQPTTSASGVGYNPALSATENARLREERNARLRKMASQH